MKPWHLITGEYPPLSGGVADYSEAVARELSRAGTEVHVWTRGKSEGVVREHSGVSVHRSVGRFGPESLRSLSRQLNRFPRPRKLLVQYVPHAFGWKAMNLYFALWVRMRQVRCGDEIQIMFHEVRYPWVRRPLPHNLIAAISNLMVWSMAPAAEILYTATTAWTEILKSLGAPADRIVPLPIPSNVPGWADESAIAAVRQRLGIGETRAPVIGHFGTYGRPITDMLTPAICEIAVRLPDWHLLLIGGGGNRYRDQLLQKWAEWAHRITATGRLDGAVVPAHIRACDVMLQPYPDGANTRRGSLLACLINGRAIVSTEGRNCEPHWVGEGLLKLVPGGDGKAAADAAVRLIENPGERERLGRWAEEYYSRHYAVDRTIETLLANSR